MNRLSILAIGATLLVSSCNLYKKYERPEVNTDVFRSELAGMDSSADADTTNFGNLPWRELFTDPLLQGYIEQGLTNNIDLLTAALSVKQAQAQLTASRLSFFPSFTFAPTGTVSSWDRSKASQVYSLPIQASWSVDLFGSLLNTKRAAQVALLQSKDYQVSVQTNLVANIANSYFTLLMLDEQLKLTRETADLTKRTWEVMEARKDYGTTTEASVQSAKASHYSVLASIPEIQRQITVAENTLSLLLGQPVDKIERSTLAAQSMPNSFPTGVPVQLLSNRADVHAAEMTLANCYYQVNVARAAFYPALNITGSAAWTNSSGAGIVNPGKLLATAVGSLTQPLFAKGQLVAALKVAKAAQEKAFLAWQYSVLSAGSEVSNALALYESSSEKSRQEAVQIESLKKNVEIAQELFGMDASTTYLEVITAQQSLLSAQLTKISDDFYKMQAVVNLYYALGGGRY